MNDQSKVQRREFVKQGALAASALTAFHALPSKSARAQQPIKIGVVGCGGRGRGAMINAIQADDSVEVVALADIFSEKFDVAKKELEKAGKSTEVDTFLGFQSYQDLVQTDCDYVILATPPCYRPESLEAAVEAGKHVFMEKPAAVDPNGIRRIFEAGNKAKEKGLSIVAGTQRRHQTEYQQTIKRIHDGEIGEVVNGQVYWCGGPIGFPEREPDWSDVEWHIRSWYHWLWLSGDHILEQHVHNIDVMTWVIGEYPIRAYGSGGRAWQQRGNIYDHHAVEFEFATGLRIQSMCSQYPREDGRVEERFQGTQGNSFTAQNGPWHLTSKRGETIWQHEGPKSSPYVLEHADLIKSIRNGDGLNESHNVAASTLTAMMGRMAEYQGKIVTWDEAMNADETFPIYHDFSEVNDPGAPPPGGKEYTGEEGWMPG